MGSIGKSTHKRQLVLGGFRETRRGRSHCDPLAITSPRNDDEHTVPPREAGTPPAHAGGSTKPPPPPLPASDRRCRPGESAVSRVKFISPVVCRFAGVRGVLRAASGKRRHCASRSARFAGGRAHCPAGKRCDGPRLSLRLGLRRARLLLVARRERRHLARLSARHAEKRPWGGEGDRPCTATLSDGREPARPRVSLRLRECKRGPARRVRSPTRRP